MIAAEHEMTVKRGIGVRQKRILQSAALKRCACRDRAAEAGASPGIRGCRCRRGLLMNGDRPAASLRMPQSYGTGASIFWKAVCRRRSGCYTPQVLSRLRLRGQLLDAGGVVRLVVDRIGLGVLHEQR